MIEWVAPLHYNTAAREKIVLSGSNLYVTAADTMFAVSTTDGTVAWTFTGDGHETLGPPLADAQGSIYIAGNKRLLATLNG